MDPHNPDNYTGLDGYTDWIGWYADLPDHGPEYDVDDDDGDD